MNTPPEFFPPGSRVGVLTTEPVGRLLDYLVPPGGVWLHALVMVPLGPRQVLGCVWGPGGGDFPSARLRALAQVPDLPPLRPEMIAFLSRAADYTLTPLSQMLRLATRAPGLATPPGQISVLVLTDQRPDRMTPARARVIDFLSEHGQMRFQAGELSALAGVSHGVIAGLRAAGVLAAHTAPRDTPGPPLNPDLPAQVLTPDQAEAAQALRASVAARAYGTTLLRGVTGSGKTEVYLEAVAQAMAMGRQALVLLPEIALTGAFLERVEARFGARPGAWHSGATGAERRALWKAAGQGEVQLVVGARSALFLPFADLGLIVVDEEHDSSYKQEDGVHYHARDMAVLRASYCQAAVVLSSATPSLESWANAQAGKYARIDLPRRFGAAGLPDMAAIDMRAQAMPAGSWISPALRAAVSDTLAGGGHALLFLNRRGYAPLTLCRACGHQVGCDHCDARMVEHRFLGRLVCHQCGASRPVPDTCPACGVQGKMAPVGPGVERLAEEVAETWPQARLAILSSDVAGTARELRARIEQIAAGGADIVIGTQIVAKGHNFPDLTLVGVIDADLGLQGGDLRAAEKSFQLMRQVAGRAGRAERPGRALVQTWQPEHPVIQAILKGDDEAFWQAEAEARARAGAPPYGRMAGVVLSGPNETAVFEFARRMARDSASITGAGAQVFGPAAAPVARISGRWRVRLLIKAPRACPLQDALRRWLAAHPVPAALRLTVDIDPQSFF